MVWQYGGDWRRQVSSHEHHVQPSAVHNDDAAHGHVSYTRTHSNAHSSNTSANTVTNGTAELFDNECKTFSYIVFVLFLYSHRRHRHLRPNLRLYHQHLYRQHQYQLHQHQLHCICFHSCLFFVLLFIINIKLFISLHIALLQILRQISQQTVSTLAFASNV